MSSLEFQAGYAQRMVDDIKKTNKEANQMLIKLCELLDTPDMPLDFKKKLRAVKEDYQDRLATPTKPKEEV